MPSSRPATWISLLPPTNRQLPRAIRPIRRPGQNCPHPAYSSSLLSNDSDRLARLTEAYQSANQAVAIAPNNSDAYAIRAFVEDWNADPALDPLRTGTKKAADFIFDAQKDAVQSLSLNSQNPLGLAYYAEILIDQQKWDQAALYIKPAIQLGSQVMDVHRVYGYYLESTGNYNEAIAEYQKALAIDPNLTFLYLSIGNNYRTLAFQSTLPSQQSDLYNSARSNYAKAITIDDQLKISNPLPYIAIAKTYAQQGQFFAAALNAQEAISIDPPMLTCMPARRHLQTRPQLRDFHHCLGLRCERVRCAAILPGCAGREQLCWCPSKSFGTQHQQCSLLPGSWLCSIRLCPTHPEYCPETCSC